MAQLDVTIARFEQALLSVDRLTVQHTFEALHRELTAVEMLDTVITPVLEHIGQQWETGQAALSQVYMSGILCEELMTTLLPPTSASLSQHQPVAIVTFEDYHTLGKRIVAAMLKAAGLPVRDYGHGVGVDNLVTRVKADNIRVLLISTLMLPSALDIQHVRTRLDHRVKIAVGGAPFRFDTALWQQVGADAMGRNAAESVTITQTLLEATS